MICVSLANIRKIFHNKGNKINLANIKNNITFASSFFDNRLKHTKDMANHKSAEKRHRQSEKRRIHNKYYARTTRNAVKALRNTTDKAAAIALLPKVASMLDKLAKINVIHKNKAANLKSSLALLVNKLAA
jgi:small subunit ribosomal protein S20